MTTAAPLHVRLDEADFRALVAGGVVEIPTGDRAVRIILADIGWGAMAAALYDAQAGQSRNAGQ